MDNNEQNQNEIVFKERKRIVLFGLPFTFTVYTITEDFLSIKEGFFSQTTNDCYLYKIQDVTLKKSLFERMFGLGTIICHTGDSTHPVLELKHIKNSDSIKDYLLKTSESERIKRRTVPMQDITADDYEDMDIF